MSSQVVFRLVVEVHGKEPRNEIKLTNDVSKPVSDAIKAPIANRVSQILGQNLSTGMVLPIAVAVCEGKEATNERLVHFRLPINMEKDISQEKIEHMANVLANEIREPIKRAATKANSRALHLHRIAPMEAE